MKDTFYVTTPIYYVNDVPHIGHSYTTIAADVVSRFHTIRGKKVFFLTGTDEHGKKIEKSAEDSGIEPKELADRVCLNFKELWEKLNIKFSRFIRTTEPDHKRAVKHIWKKIYEKGDIYRGTYTDWYCIHCESFWTSSQLIENKCPDCGREVDQLSEESYFFKLSKYEKSLLEFYKSNPDFVKPSSRMNEIVSFVKQGLKDLSVSRMKLKWGITVPEDEQHIIYVWFDALTNYLTGAGYPDDNEKFNSIWPADVHIVGKDILRFHAVYWPAFLMSAELPLPERIFAHGWWTVNGEKMSKSRGNVIDPFEEIKKYGVDRYRYFLLREVPFGLDGDYSSEAIKHRSNSELSNDVGNLFSRVCAMIKKYKNGSTGSVIEGELISSITECVKIYIENMEKMALQQAIIEGLLKAAREANTYIDRKKPWELKKENKENELNNILGETAEALRLIASMCYPFMPDSARKMLDYLGLPVDEEKIVDTFSLDRKKWITRIKEIKSIFPRIE